MVSVRQCVILFTLSLCISSSIVDSRRHRKHRRRESRIRGRPSSYTNKGRTISRYDDCVDCDGPSEIEADYYDEPYRYERRISKIRRRKKGGIESEPKKESTSSIWNWFNFWSDDDKSGEKTENVKERKGPRRRKGRRKQSTRRRGRYSDSRYVASRQRQKAPVYRERLDRFQKARRQNGSAKRRGRNGEQYRRRDSYYNDRVESQYTRRKGGRGRSHRGNRNDDWEGERGRHSKRFDNDRRRGSRKHSEPEESVKGPYRPVTRRRYRGEGRVSEREKLPRPETTQYEKKKETNNGKKNRRRKISREKSSKQEYDSVESNSGKSHAGKSHGLKNGKRGEKPDQSDSYSSVSMELHKLNVLEENPRKKYRKKKKGNKKDDIDKIMSSPPPSSSEEDSKNYSNKDGTPKKPHRKRKRKGNRVKNGQNIKDQNKKIVDEKTIHESSIKKGSPSSKGKSKKERMKLPKRGRKKDIEKDNEKTPSLSGGKKKSDGRKKDQSITEGEEKKSPRKSKDAINKEPSKMSDKTDKSEERKSDSSTSRKKSKKGRKKSKSKSGDKRPNNGKNVVNNAFNVFTNAQNIEQNQPSSTKPSTKSEAEKQVDALTDEQLIYALKVAEKRFKRSDRRIKRKLTNLKEITLQHLNAIESLQVSLEQQSFPVITNQGSRRESYNELSSLHPKNQIPFPQNKDQTFLGKSAVDLKTNAKNVLDFTQISQKMDSLLNDTFEKDESSPAMQKKKSKDKNKLTSSLKKDSSVTEESTKNSQKKLLSNDSKKTSNRKSDRKGKEKKKKKKKKKKRKKGKEKIFSSKEKKGKNESALKSIFESLDLPIKKPIRDQTWKRLNSQKQTMMKSAESEEAKVESQFKSRSRSRRPQGGRNRGYDRHAARYQSIEDRARYRKIYRAVPMLNRHIREIRQRLRHVLQPFITNMKLSDSYYQAIFNATRSDIIDGAREIIKKINEANDDVYEAVMGASKLARSIYMKAQRGREAGRANVLREEQVYQRAIESKVERKDFRIPRKRVIEQHERITSSHSSLNMMDMKSRQLKSRFIQVHERFLDKFDHEAFRHLYGNMRSTIDILNNGLRSSNQLRQLHRGKKYVKSIRREVTTAQNLLKNSSSMYRTGRMKLQENVILVLRVKKESRDLRRKRMLADSPGPGLTSRQYEKLERLTRKAKQHAQHLNEEMYQAQRILNMAIQKANRAIEKSSRVGGKINPFAVILKDLKTILNDAVASLDELRQFIGSENRISIQGLRGCKTDHINIDSDDEDFGCDVDGSGMECSGSGDITFVDSDEDFTFDGEIESFSSSRPKPLQLFGKELEAFTTKILKASVRQSDEAKVITQSLNGLKGKWNDIEKNRAPFIAKVKAKRFIADSLATVIINSTEIRERIKQTNKKINELNKIDFEKLHAKAKAAISSAEKNNNKGEDGLSNDQPEESSGSDITVFSDLLKADQTITTSIDKIKRLQKFAVNTIETSNNRLNVLRGNITQLWQKVKMAKNLLNSMQLSILKEGDSPVVSTALSDDLKLSESMTTSFSLCIKPKTLDGTVLYSQGNNSISYAIKLDGGDLIASVYDKDHEELTELELDGNIEKDKWYTISLLRVGQTLNLTAGRDGMVYRKSVEVEDMPKHQLAPSLSYIGGIQDNLNSYEGESWKGCVSEILVNHKAMNLFNPAMDGTSTSLCSDHCVSQGKQLSWSFDGGGFVHYGLGQWTSIESLTLRFRSIQSYSAILSVAHKRSSFYLLVKLDNGAVKIESAAHREEKFLISFNNTFNDGKAHTLKIRYKGRRIISELDENKNAFSAENSRRTILRKIKEGILLGAFVSDEEFLGGVHSPLIGCASILSVNNKRPMHDEILQYHNVYYGNCTRQSIWQSCVHFTDTSQPLSLGEVHSSNELSMLVLRNSTGPLLLYTKKDIFKIELNMTDDGINVSSDDEKGILVRSEDYKKKELFDLITFEDDGYKITVKAFDESTEFTYYDSWVFRPDITVPHTIEFGQTRDGSDKFFDFSISQLIISGRMYDLTEHVSNHTLKACQLPGLYLKRHYEAGLHMTESVKNL